MAERLEINPERLRSNMEGLARFGRDPEGGWSRFAFTEEEKRAREFTAGLMEKAGMDTRVDAAGNLFGRRPGAERDLPAVAAGSHIDTVKNGGLFDGATGVMAAVEAVQAIHENGLQTRHPLEVIVFANEEGARFNKALWGSRALLGAIPESEMHMQDRDGITVAAAMQAAGLDPSRIAGAKIDGTRYRAFLEVHPEQGSVLETSGARLGVVEAVAGSAWIKATLHGKPDHAGATPMGLRRDALAAAAEIVLALERMARHKVGPHTVATVGRLTVSPGGVNIIPGRVEMWLDIRDVSPEGMEKAVRLAGEAVTSICEKRGIAVHVEESGRVMPVPLPGEMAVLIEETCREEGISCRRLYSGAGHDAQVMSFLTRTGMIFLPSVGGISHNPEEKTGWGDVANGALVLLRLLLKLAGSC